MNNAQYICSCIEEGKEFEFVDEVSKYYKVDFYKMCDFTLDLYNYHKRCGLDNVGSKIMSLQTLCEFAHSISKSYEVKK